MLKKITVGMLAFAWMLSGIATFQQAIAQTNIVNITVLERYDCIHCQAEKEFLEELKLERSDINVTYLDIYDPINNALWKNVAEVQGISKVTPITLIGNTVIQGFGTADTTGVVFKGLIDQMKSSLAEKDKNLTFQKVVQQGGTKNAGMGAEACEEECVATPLLVSIPFYGPLDISRFALPTLSMILGTIDGFNPCAMWALITFIIIISQTGGTRRRMWELVGLFLLAQAVMYYLILNVWLTVWDFVGLDNIVTPIIGTLAIAAGLYFLYKGITYKGVCTVTNVEERAETRTRMQKLAGGPLTLLSALAIIGLAFSINIIEFACSIGVPQTFTKILDINPLSVWIKQFYIGLYMLMYMIDDLIVFAIGLYSLEKIGATSKYSKYSSLIGGALMVLLGYILIFHREFLIF
jgi:cytochrome c biogenesis protein CcdA